MRLLKEIVRKQGIDLQGKTIYREAVRGVIINNKNLLMIHSRVNGDYKFPGGGVEPEETYKETLIREVKEESGATIKDIMDEFGKVVEYDIPSEPEFDVFKMTSYYYLCNVGDELEEQALDQYEEDLGFKPTWIDIDEAIECNKAILKSAKRDIPRWTARETYILELIKEHIII
jgi:8-oxo-dGTP pyrophosphatase MutT (NUDIX family)